MSKYTQYALKFEFCSGRYRFCITIPYTFMSNQVTKLPYLHSHAKHEIVFVRYEDGRQPNRFLVIPPFFEHYTYHEDNNEHLFAAAFRFSIEEEVTVEAESRDAAGSVLGAFLQLKQPAVIEDAFYGGQRIDSIRREFQERPAGYFETVNAQFLLLLTELARRLPVEQGSAPPPERSLDEIRLDYIDYFFVDNYSRPGCKKEELARLLCVSERQLSRILEEHYHMSFRQRLLHTRMEIAEAWRRMSRVSSEQLAELVGYSSAPAFLRAYRNYFGYPFRALNSEKDE